MYVIEHAHVLQWAYNEAQGLLEFESPTILGLLGSKWYLSHPPFVFFFGGGVVGRRAGHTACGILVPPSGIEPGRLQWKHQVLTNGPPGNSPVYHYFNGCALPPSLLSQLDSNFLLKISIWRPVLPVFPKHRVPHSWSLPSTPFRVCWRSATTVTNDSILLEIHDKRDIL